MRPQDLSRFQPVGGCARVVGRFLMRHRGHSIPTNWISLCLLALFFVEDHVLAVLPLPFALEADRNNSLHLLPPLWVTGIYSLPFVS